MDAEGKLAYQKTYTNEDILHIPLNNDKMARAPKIINHHHADVEVFDNEHGAIWRFTNADRHELKWAFSRNRIQRGKYVLVLCVGDPNPQQISSDGIAYFAFSAEDPRDLTLDQIHRPPSPRRNPKNPESPSRYYLGGPVLTNQVKVPLVAGQVYAVWMDEENEMHYCELFVRANKKDGKAGSDGEETLKMSRLHDGLNLEARKGRVRNAEERDALYLAVRTTVETSLFVHLQFIEWGSHEQITKKKMYLLPVKTIGVHDQEEEGEVKPNPTNAPSGRYDYEIPIPRGRSGSSLKSRSPSKPGSSNPGPSQPGGSPKPGPSQSRRSHQPSGSKKRQR